MSMYGMNKGLPVPVSSFPFPHYYPDTGTGSNYLNRTYVGRIGQPILDRLHNA
jgi:hypothetical protein